METRASCYNFQLKSFVVKIMFDALFMSTCTLNVLFVLIKYTIPLLFRIVVRQICEVSQAPSTITTSPVCGCYSKERMDGKASVSRTCYGYSINVIIHTYTCYTQCA